MITQIIPIFLYLIIFSGALLSHTWAMNNNNKMPFHWPLPTHWAPPTLNPQPNINNIVLAFPQALPPLSNTPPYTQLHLEGHTYPPPITTQTSGVHFSHNAPHFSDNEAPQNTGYRPNPQGAGYFLNEVYGQHQGPYPPLFQPKTATHNFDEELAQSFDEDSLQPINDWSNHTPSFYVPFDEAEAPSSLFNNRFEFINDNDQPQLIKPNRASNDNPIEIIDSEIDSETKLEGNSRTNTHQYSPYPINRSSALNNNNNSRLAQPINASVLDGLIAFQRVVQTMIARSERIQHPILIRWAIDFHESLNQFIHALQVTEDPEARAQLELEAVATSYIYFYSIAHAECPWDPRSEQYTLKILKLSAFNMSTVMKSIKNAALMIDRENNEKKLHLVNILQHWSSYLFQRIQPLSSHKSATHFFYLNSTNKRGRNIAIKEAFYKTALKSHTPLNSDIKSFFIEISNQLKKNKFH